MLASTMFRLGVPVLTLATLVAWAHPGTFAFTIGDPVASQDFHFKTAALCFVRNRARSRRSHRLAVPPKAS